VPAHDPVAAIRSIQRSQQRFWRGFPVTVVLAVLLAPGWAATFAPIEPFSKPRLIAACAAAAIVALPLRLLGRVSEWRLAIWAGVLASLALWLGDCLARWALEPAMKPVFSWWATPVTYAAAVWIGAIAARKELAVEMTRPGLGSAATDLPPLQPWEDENAIVLQEPASIFRWIATPGTLTLTNRHLRFVQRGKHAIDPQIALAAVQGAQHSALTNAFAITLRDGTVHRFVVFNRDNWIVQINTRINAARITEAARVPS
jgi:hypothetical protein